MTIGGVGESNFDVNTSTGSVVYNDSKGVHVLKIDPKTNLYQIDDVQKGMLCWGVFWIDNEMIWCLLLEGNKFVKFSAR